VPEGGKHLVFVPAGERTEQREVKIGKNNSHHVQLVEGLAEGDEVLLYDPRADGAGGAGRGAPGAGSSATTSTDDEGSGVDGSLPGAALE
jgi:hypothetical protein